MTKKEIRERITNGYYDAGVYVDYNNNHDEYYAKQHQLEREFAHDISIACGVESNPKTNKLFELAWQHGHADGFYKVFYYYETFAELIKD
jgi:hypothetical protein